MVQISGEISKPFWSMRSERVWQKYTPPSSPLSKDKGLKNIGHSVSIRNLIFGVSSVTVSGFTRYDSLLQNATDVITKCVWFFITKCDSFITKCNTYYKIPRFCYKMRQLLENATFITNCDSTNMLHKCRRFEHSRPFWKEMKALNVYQINLIRTLKLMHKTKYGVNLRIFLPKFCEVDHQYPTRFSQNSLYYKRSACKTTSFAIMLCSLFVYLFVLEVC